MANIRFVLENYFDDSTVSTSIADDIVIVNNSFGDVTDTGAGTSGFAVVTDTQGDVTTAEQSTVTTIANVDCNLDGLYFEFDDGNPYYIWYDCASYDAVMVIEHNSVGVITDAVDVDTGFTISVLIQGDASTQEVTSIACAADVSGSLNNTSFNFSNTTIDFYCWYNVNSAGSDPGGIGTGLEITISTDATANQVQLATLVKMATWIPGLAFKGISTVDPNPGGTGIRVLLDIDNTANEVATRTRDAIALSSAGVSFVENGFETNLPIAKAKEVTKSSIARSTGTDDIEIKGVLSSKKSVSALIIGRHNFSINTRYRLRLYDGADFATELFDSGEQTVSIDEIGSAVVPWGDFEWGTDPWGGDTAITDEFAPAKNLVYWLSSEINSVSAYKLDIYKGYDAPLATYSNLEFSRLILGAYIEPTYNLSLNHALSWEENTKQYRTEAGSLRSDSSVPFRRFQFNITTIPESERTILQNGFRYVGLRKDFFFSTFPTDTDIDKQTDYSAISKITKIPKFTEFVNNYYKSSYIIEEV